MSESATLARPYARAAFEVARDAGALDAWSANLAVAAAIAVDPRIAALGNDPEVEPAELARLHQPEGVDAGSAFARFLAELADNRRLALLPDVAAQFEALRRAAANVVKVRVRCATEPTPEQKAGLERALKNRYASDIDLDVTVDEHMLGGAIIDVGGEVIDGSVHARLQQLQSALMR